MNMHTSGPWEIRGSYALAAAIRSPGGHIIAQVKPRYSDDGRLEPDALQEFEGNLRLIASSPDLLAALQDVVASYDANDSRGVAEAVEASRVAIAKATTRP